MKYFLVIVLFLPPVSAMATKLGNCDTKSYEVTITNGGAKRVTTLAPNDASIEESGPLVSFSIPDQPPVIVTEPGDEYCIWNGKIKIQRRNSGYNGTGGCGLR